MKKIEIDSTILTTEAYRNPNKLITYLMEVFFGKRNQQPIKDNTQHRQEANDQDIDINEFYDISRSLYQFKYLK